LLPIFYIIFIFINFFIYIILYTSLSSGAIKHAIGEKDQSRWCKGKQRKSFQEQLLHKKASVKLRELSVKSDPDATMSGNITSTFSLRVLQKIRDEVS